MNPPHPISIFINYRRVDTLDQARKIKEALLDQLGRDDHVFLDERDIQLTEKWQPKLQEELKRAEIVLSLIGPDWEAKIRERQATDTDKKVNDWVLFEIREALAERIDIIPVFIYRDKADDLTQLLPEEFPEAIRVFNSQGFVISKNQFDEGLDRLIRSLKVFTGQEKQGYHPAPEMDYLSALPLDRQAYLEKLWEKDDAGHFKVPSPFPGPIFFSDQEALLYTGRSKEIRTLYHLVRQNRLVLLHGYSGTGKSSLIHAGLYPRMAAVERWQVPLPVRRSKLQGGLAKQLEALLQTPVDPEKRVLIILDQVEEMYNDPLNTLNGYTEMAELGSLLKTVMSDRPQYHILLCFRSEFLAQITEGFLPDHRLHQFRELYLSPLKEENIAEAILTPASDPDLRSRFRFQIPKAAEQLPKIIARDFVGDQFKPYGVLLQIQLRALWEAAIQAAAEQGALQKEWTETLYQANRKTDLSSFIKEQLQTIRQSDAPDAASKPWEKAVNSGLILDVLYQFVTIAATAGSINNDEFADLYPHLTDPAAQAILNKLKSVYLLSAADRDGRSTRLAHDSLADDIRRKYQASALPGQQARRLYEAKKKAFDQSPAPRFLFSESDARTILDGLTAMAAIPADHQKKIEQDLENYREQHEKNFQLAFTTARKNLEDFDFAAALTNLDIAGRENLDPTAVLEKIEEAAYPLAFLKDRDGLHQALQLLQNSPGADPGWAEWAPPDPEEKTQTDLFIQKMEPWPPAYHPERYAKGWDRFFPSMIAIQGGTFFMGAREDDAAYGHERPGHEVAVPGFRLADTPVTWWQYGLFCKATGRPLPMDSGFGRGYRPVINVSWYEAVVYCNWLSYRQGLTPVYQLGAVPENILELHNQVENWDECTDWTANGYRLPTEAEWEYAAGGGAENRTLFGNGTDTANPAQMNFDAAHINNRQAVKWNWIKEEDMRADNAFRGATTEAKAFKPNRLKLYDMSGNVFEWCWDRFSGELDQPNPYYQECKDAGPTENPRGAQTGNQRVVRGGSWYAVVVACRSSYRVWNVPFYQVLNLGFRVARRL